MPFHAFAHDDPDFSSICVSHFENLIYLHLRAGNIDPNPLAFRRAGANQFHGTVLAVSCQMCLWINIFFKRNISGFDSQKKNKVFLSNWIVFEKHWCFFPLLWPGCRQMEIFQLFSSYTAALFYLSCWFERSGTETACAYFGTNQFRTKPTW